MESSNTNALITLLFLTSGSILWMVISNLHEKISELKKKTDLIISALDGLREYLYEIDPQFDDERETARAFENDEHIFAGMDDLKLLMNKREQGKRTLNTTFHEQR